MCFGGCLLGGVSMVICCFWWLFMGGGVWYSRWLVSLGVSCFGGTMGCRWWNDVGSSCTLGSSMLLCDTDIVLIFVCHGCTEGNVKGLL